MPSTRSPAKPPCRSSKIVPYFYPHDWHLAHDPLPDPSALWRCCSHYACEKGKLDIVDYLVNDAQ
jgi:hypothetical protein